MTTITVSAESHLWRVNFEMPEGQPYLIQGYGEAVLTLPDGTMAKSTAGLHPTLSSSRPIERAVAAVAGTTVETAGGPVSVAMIMEALPLLFTQWAEEDAAKINEAASGAVSGAHDADHSSAV